MSIYSLTFGDKHVILKDIDTLRKNSAFIDNLIPENSEIKIFPLTFKYTKYYEMAIRIVESKSLEIVQNMQNISDIYQLIYTTENLQFTKLTASLRVLSESKYSPGQILSEFVRETNAGFYSQTIISQVANHYPTLVKTYMTTLSFLHPKYIALIFQNISFVECDASQQTDALIEKVINHSASNAGVDYEKLKKREEHKEQLLKSDSSNAIQLKPNKVTKFSSSNAADDKNTSRPDKHSIAQTQKDAFHIALDLKNIIMQVRNEYKLTETAAPKEKVSAAPKSPIKSSLPKSNQAYQDAAKNFIRKFAEIDKEEKPKYLKEI